MNQKQLLKDSNVPENVPVTILNRIPPNSLGGKVNVPDTRNSSYGTARNQGRHFVAAAAGTCFGARSNAMSTHQDLIPEPHTRTSKKMSKDRQRRAFYCVYIYIYRILADLHTSSYKNFQ